MDVLAVFMWCVCICGPAILPKKKDEKISFMGYIVGVALISFNGSRLELNPVVDFSDLAQECKTYDELIEK